MTRVMRAVALIGGCVLLLSSAGEASAQTLTLRLTQDSTEIPVVGAIVRLISQDARVVATELSSPSGGVVLQAGSAGSYRARIDRIGFAVVWVGPLALGEGQTVRISMRLPTERVTLPPIEVIASSKCGDVGGSPLALVLWEEIEKALAANTVTQRSGPTLLVESFQREVDLDGQVQREWVYNASLRKGQPFVTRPPAELAERGFMVTVRDSFNFSAPDAALLLSTEFIGTHCFHAVPGEGNLVGLQFEPVEGRKVPDVRGVLWVDRITEELRDIEYEYTGIKGILEKANLGGRLVFQRLETGEWIVSDWHIRMPALEARTMNRMGRLEVSVPRLVGYRDQGGKVELASRVSGNIGAAVLSGTVWDSTTGTGLAGATVTIDGTPASTITDAAGVFEFVVPFAGPHTITATHRKLGLLGEPATVPAVLSLGDSSAVALGTPSMATLAKAFCRGAGAASMIVGTAWKAEGVPAKGRVRATWVTSSGGSKATTSSPGDGGLYALCDVPSGQTVTLQLEAGQSTLLNQDVRLRPGERRWLDLEPWVMGTIPVAKVIAALTGPSVLMGVVRNDSTGAPLAGVDVVLERSSRIAQTDANGRFRLDSLPSGRHVVLFRAVGHRPERQWISLPAGDTLRVEPRLVPSDVVLPELTVTAESQAYRMDVRAREERQRLGMGKFVDWDELRRREQSRLGDILRGIPGVTLRPAPEAGSTSQMALSSRMLDQRNIVCPMTIYLDGAVFYSSPGPAADPSAAPDLNMFSVSSLEAVEVFRSAAEAPIEYGGSNAACGVILLWTRAH